MAKKKPQKRAILLEVVKALSQVERRLDNTTAAVLLEKAERRLWSMDNMLTQMTTTTLQVIEAQEKIAAQVKAIDELQQKMALVFDALRDKLAPWFAEQAAQKTTPSPHRRRRPARVALADADRVPEVHAP